MFHSRACTRRRSKDQANLAFRLEEVSIAPGETVTVTFGDRNGGSRGFRVQTFSTDLLLLPLYVDFTGDGLFLSLDWPGLTVIGQPVVEAARLFVPSIVAPGEPFLLSVRSEDRWSNRSSGRIPAYEVLLDGKPWRKLPAGERAVQFIADARIDQPGIHRFSVESSDGKVSATSNPVWVRADAKRRVYWGETHGHCGFGEGQGSPTSFFEFGRDDSRLDFLTVTEHDALTDDGEWRKLDQLVRRFNDDGKFVTFLGYEWSAQRPQGGHHNVIFREPGHRRIALQEYPVLPMLYEGLRAENDLDDVLIIPHAHNAGDWTRNDAELEKLVEVSSLHGTFEWFGNLYLQSGFRVGFVGGSDDHRANPGMPLALPRPIMTQRSGIGAVWAERKEHRRDLRRAQEPLRLRQHRRADHPRRLAQRAADGHAPGRRAAAPDRSEGGGHQPDRPHRRGQERGRWCSPAATSARRSSPSRRSRSASSRRRRSSFRPIATTRGPQRVWKGSLEVAGARLLGVTTPGFDNPYSELARRDEKNPNRVEFFTQTRGRMDTLLLELEGAGPQTAIRFHLEPDGGDRIQGRQRAAPTRRWPQADFELRLDGLDDGRMEHPFQVGQHTDRIALQVIDLAAPLDQGFEYTDLTAVAPGDYYYVRVTQLDGNQAFSSPFWVGDSGRPPATPSPITDLFEESERSGALD